MKKYLAILLCFAMVLSFAACGGEEEVPETEETTPSDATVATQATSIYATAEEVMTLIWDNMAEEDHFNCYGGNQTANPVYDAPGTFDITDTDTLSFLLLVPETEQKQILDGADLVYLTNACQFTGAALKLSGDVEDFAKALEHAVLKQPFVNFAPEIITTISVGNYVVFAFGAAEKVQPFVDAALEHVQDAKLLNTAVIPFGEE